MSAIHGMYVTEANCIFENIDLSDTETRNKSVSKTPTTTLPFMETTEGNISETNAILYYLAKKYKKDLLGKDIFENAKISQWIEFASCEINRCQRAIIYPIYGWAEFCKENSDKENSNLKDYLKLLEKELEGKNYLVGNRLTLADIVLFRYLRFFMMLQFPEGMRKKVLPNTTKWFEKIMNTDEAVRAYGRTMLCKVPVKPFMEKINKQKEHHEKNEKHEKNQKKNEKNEKKDEETGEEKPAKKEKNPLDLLPPSKFNLEDFKRSFLNNKNKQEAIKKFLEEFDPEGYSLWWLEYQNLPEEGKVLYRTSNAKSFFLQKLDSFRRYCFAVHGVYGSEGDYKIRGVWMWRGKDIPKEIKENDYYDYMTIKALDPNDKEDIELINDYWTKLNETDKVQGRFAVDCSYFN